MKNVLMLASENGALKGAKVGGIADVIRDLPEVLAEQHVQADIIMPAYKFLIDQNKVRRLARFKVSFRKSELNVSLYDLPNPTCQTSRIYLLDHPAWDASAGNLYHDSGDRPFADDANQFAFFCVAVAEALLNKLIPIPDCLHLHDWHAAMFLLCSKFMPRYKPLKSLATVMTIHNLAIQGIRPLRYDESSLESWFPELYLELGETELSQIRDPRYLNCINPMRAGINLCDRLHVVSPTYAREVIKASAPAIGFFGGEGLEEDLLARKKDLFGILNGCNYPAKRDFSAVPKTIQDFYQLCQDTLLYWQGKKPAFTGQDFIAEKRLEQLIKQQFEPDFLLTSVGRITDQKMLILRQPMAPWHSTLEAILVKLAEFSDKALFVMLGSGDPTITAEFREVASRHENFLFLNGFAETIPEWLYRHGDLFLMPSSFEPCGISQMLSMREGQPCLVHAVGGLKDTVEHDKSGFVFAGDDLHSQARNLINTLEHALSTFQTDRWQKIRRSAKARRFTWQKVSKLMVEKLYQFQN